jgi:hypothetical protein
MSRSLVQWVGEATANFGGGLVCDLPRREKNGGGMKKYGIVLLTNN